MHDPLFRYTLENEAGKPWGKAEKYRREAADWQGLERPSPRERLARLLVRWALRLDARAVKLLGEAPRTRASI